MLVVKRNHLKQPFSWEKIRSVISKTFKSVGLKLTDIIWEEIKNELYFDKDEIDVEEIQNQIEQTLFESNYSEAARSFILYREIHKNARFIRERIDYMKNYSDNSENAASSSETDANANVTLKNVANLEGEVFKTSNRIIQRQRMKDALYRLYPLEPELAKQYIKDLENHIIYTHDEASTPVLKPYCMAVTLYPLMTDGVGNIDGVTPTPPNDIQSFCGQLTNLIFLLSSQCKGAVACLHGSQKLLIDDKYIAIKDLVNKYWNNPIKANDGWEYCNISGIKVFEDGKFVNVSKVYKKPYKRKIYSISSNKGFTAKTSEDHKFKVIRKNKIEEVCAKDLQLFDTVFVNNCIPIDFTSKEYKEGWIKGMLLGDGCLTQENAVQLSVCYDQVYYGDLFNEYSDELYGHTLNQNSGHKCWQYETKIKKYVAQLKEDVIGNNTFNKHIDLSNKPITYKVGLLDGLLCADGGDYHCIGISLVNKQLIEDVKQILDELFISYSYREVEAHDNKSKLYCLSISSPQLHKYCPNLYLKIDKHKKEQDVYYHSGYSRKINIKNPNYVESNGKGRFLFKNYLTDVITDIQVSDNDDEYVYEIETETHWYNCGGFITHNCGDALVALNYYVIKEYGTEWYNHLNAEVTNNFCTKPKTIKSEIRKGMKQFIYGVNQPAGNRSYNSPFTNISYYDKYYFDSLFGDFYYPDGTQPEWNAVDTLQRIFMELHRELRLIKPLTFPVTTMALVHDGKDCLDLEYKKLCADEWAKGGSFFLYLSDNPTSLASCCFTPETKVLWKSSTLGVQCTTLKELKDLKWEPDKKNLRIFHNGFWIKGKPIKTTNTNFYRVETANHKVFYMTDNHINVTFDGEKQTKNLTTDDYLMFNNRILNAVPENNENLTYEQGFAVGAFLGDGSFGGTASNGTIYNIIYSQNINKYEECMKNVTEANHQLGHEGECYLDKIHNNVYPIKISSKNLVSFIQKWTNWKRGTYSYNKELNLNCLLQSVEFRRGILDGWYNTDGENSNRCYTSSEKLKDCMEMLITSLGMNSIIDKSDRTNELVIIRDNVYNRNYPLWCVRWYEPCNKINMKDVYKWKNNSQYFKIINIEHIGESPLDQFSYCIECNDTENPYFTLPSGLITHNCRVLNEIEDNTFSSTTGMTGVMTGSCNVISLNLNRIVQDWAKWLCYERGVNVDMNTFMQDSFNKKNVLENLYSESLGLKSYLTKILERVYKYHIAYKINLYDIEDKKMFAASNGNYIYLKKLYSTIGIIGYFEAAKFLGFETNNNKDYIEFLQLILGTVKNQNKVHSIHDKKRPFLFNSEAIPGENLAVKLYKIDKKEGYWVPQDQNLYNSYFYNPWNNTSVLDKIHLHGEQVNKYTDGGQACHINLDDHLSNIQYSKLIDVAIKDKCNYFTFNIPFSECKDCGNIVHAPIHKCPKCGSTNIDWWTRIIG